MHQLAQDSISNTSPGVLPTTVASLCCMTEQRRSSWRARFEYHDTRHIWKGHYISLEARPSFCPCKTYFAKMSTCVPSAKTVFEAVVLSKPWVRVSAKQDLTHRYVSCAVCGSLICPSTAARRTSRSSPVPQVPSPLSSSAVPTGRYSRMHFVAVAQSVHVATLWPVCATLAD